MEMKAISVPRDMCHFGLLPNFFGCQTVGFQEYGAAAHTECVALAFVKAFLQLQTLVVCQFYNFDLCDSGVSLCVYA